MLFIVFFSENLLGIKYAENSIIYSINYQMEKQETIIVMEEK